MYGMLFFWNVEIVWFVEVDICVNGVVLVIIVFMDGNICVGLEDVDLDCFVQVINVMKCFCVDLIFVLVINWFGVIIVVVMMMVVYVVGFKVFVIGGIGGVYKGVEISFDIFVDFDEFSCILVCVVFVGVKVFLDILKIFEVLEIKGVLVVVYGMDELLVFWFCQSGFFVFYSLLLVVEIGEFLKMCERFVDYGGVLIVNLVFEVDEIL